MFPLLSGRVPNPRLLARAVVVILALSSASSSVSAQHPRLSFERFAQDRGLSNGTVTAMIQSHSGFLWLGTEDGLNRYDGTGFELFRPVPGDTTSLPDGWITGLAASRTGPFWVATLRGGVHRFNPGKGFQHFRHSRDNPRSLSSDQVNAIIEARNGIVWVGTQRGLDRLDPTTGLVTRYPPVPADSADMTNQVTAIAEDGDSRLWVGTRMGVFLFDETSGSFEPLGIALRTRAVRNFLVDSAGTLWVGTEHELLAVNPATRKVRMRYGSATPSRPSPITGRVTALYQDPAGTLWVGSDRGLTRLDPSTGKFERHTYDPSDPRSLGGTIVRSLLVDRGGVLWVGMESYGVSKHAPSAIRFDLIVDDPSVPHSLSDGYIRGITDDRRGHLWIGTQYGGLNRLDLRTGRVRVYRHDPHDPKSLPNDDVWQFLEDRTGTTWVGLHGAGLGTFDTRTGEFTRFPLVPAEGSVNILYEDSAGALLVGLEGQGLYEISPDRSSVRTFGSKIGDVRVLAEDDVQAILEDHAGFLWVGGAGGLTRIDRSTGQATHFHGTPGGVGTLGSDFVTNIVEDSRGTLWVATKGGGLSWLDRKSGRFNTIGIPEGMPSSFVYGVLEDARGNLWLSTDDGIAMLDATTHAVTHYGLEDGLQAREFNRRAHYRAADGTMYFGGINGVNVFRPDEVAAAPPPPPVSLVALAVEDEPATPIIDMTVDSVLMVRHDHNAFTISFAALDFTAPEKIRYSYRLDGVDRDWVQAGTRTDVSYTSVPPGRHTFQVRAANASGVWSAQNAGVTIFVESPWWGTWWARILGVLILIGVPLGVVRLRLRAVRGRSALLERRVREQTRDVIDAQARLREALERERDAARELFAITAAVPGAVFQLRETPDGIRSLQFVSDGVARLESETQPANSEDEEPRTIAGRLLARLDEPDREAMARSLSLSRDTLEPWRTEASWTTEAGETRWLSLQARPSRDASGATVWTGVATDATAERHAHAERSALETKMREAQKAESLGILAGGIAHDFNNLLVGVLAGADLLRDEVLLNDEGAETLSHIRGSALRAAELTQQMLAYAGKGRLVIEEVDLADLVREMLALLRSAVPRTIPFEFHAGESPALVEADATQLRQVVMNLVTNASEAIGDVGGRVLVQIGTETARASELALLHAAPDMPLEGPYARLEVCDDGCGMDPVLLARIFDPFYTTKFTGRGLGLAALLGIVRAHHGGLNVLSTPGRGTKFLIYLPLAKSESIQPPVIREVVEPVQQSSPACVLVVDDEEPVRLSLVRMLERLGSRVIAAVNGSQALAAMEGEHGVDLVLMDVTMPVMDGPSTARALRARGEDVPIVMMSGYAEEDLVARGVMADADYFLKKPFATSELATVLRRAALAHTQ